MGDIRNARECLFKTAFQVPPEEDPRFRKSRTFVVLVALPVSSDALQSLAGTDLDQLGVQGIAPSGFEAQSPPVERFVAFGPYNHQAWAGHFVVPRNQYTFPDGRSFAFTCEPGQKWGACSVTYVLRPGLGLTYVVWQHGTPLVEGLTAQVVAVDRKIRAYALGLIVPTPAGAGTPN